MAHVDHRQEAIGLLEHYLDIACKMTCDRDEMAAIVDNIIAAAVEEMDRRAVDLLVNPPVIGHVDMEASLRSKNEALDQEAVTLRDEATTLRATILSLEEASRSMVNRIRHLDRELALSIAPRREITSPDPTNTEESR